MFLKLAYLSTLIFTIIILLAEIRSVRNEVQCVHDRLDKIEKDCQVHKDTFGMCGKIMKRVSSSTV